MKKLFVLMAAIVLLTGCVARSEYNAQKDYADSLASVCTSLKKANMALQKELDGYRYSPAKLLSDIRQNYESKDYQVLKQNLDLMRKYHPEAGEMSAASNIYSQAAKEQEAARKKAEAEAAKREAERRAKMSKIERIMEKYDCSENIATLISRGQVRIGMTAEQCRASWGRPNDINRSTGTWGVHEQWCYGGHNYLYFEDGILTSIQN